MFQVYNSLGKKLEEFKPISKGKVGLYSCGPTVYDYAHIGNLRSYVFSDILRRTLEYLGHEVIQVVNITDIGHLTSDADSGDDKMVKGLKREGLPLTLDGLRSLANKYEEAFKQDLKTLNIKTPHHFPRATDYLKQEIELVQELEKKGYAYKISDGIYFDTGKLGDKYGKLGGLTPLGEAEARIGAEGKKSSRDFVLWKLSKDDHMGFPSPWGQGFPGWHIECSAMSRALLGQPFDIHTGGIDHIPVHHNNEIAQSEAAYDTGLANYWMHNEFVNLNDGKMAKSEGNSITLKSIVENGYFPLAYRYFLLKASYHAPLNFSDHFMKAFQDNEYRKLKKYFAILPKGWLFWRGRILKTYKNEFTEAMSNDLNTPQALATMWKLIDDNTVSSLDKRATLLDFDKILGLKLSENEFEVKNIPNDVSRLFDEYKKARIETDFVKSDSIREEIRKKKFIVEDTKEGSKLTK